MPFKKYIHLERLDSSAVEGLLDERCKQYLHIVTYEDKLLAKNAKNQDAVNMINQLKVK